MSTVAVRYEIVQSLSKKRQRAIKDAYGALRLAAWSSAQREGNRSFLARETAEQCRALIAAFGVRRARRWEQTRRTSAELLALAAQHAADRGRA